MQCPCSRSGSRWQRDSDHQSHRNTWRCSLVRCLQYGVAFGTERRIRWCWLLAWTWIDTYPYDEQHPPYAPFGSQVAPAKSLPHLPSLRGAVAVPDGAGAEDEEPALQPD